MKIEDMDIDVKLKVNLSDEKTTEIASGWIQIEDILKFPFKIRKYLDKDGVEKCFVSYPQRKTEEGYEKILFPDNKAREEIEKTIMQELRYTKAHLYSDGFDEVRVTILPEPKKMGSVYLKGIASIKVLGITVNGITIKEGKNGLIVNMPQYKVGDEYQDMVYCPSNLGQRSIYYAVVDAYKAQLKKEETKKLQNDTVIQKDKLVPELSQTKTPETMGPHI